MAHFRKITVDGIEYEYRLNSLTFFVRNKELKIRHSVTTEKLDKELDYCEDCGINCYREHRPVSVLPSTVAAYIKGQDFHKPLQSKSQEPVLSRKKRIIGNTIYDLSDADFLKMRIESAKRERKAKIEKEARKLAKKNKTQPKKKASSNGPEWRQAALENEARERKEREEKRRLARHREHWGSKIY